MTARNINRRAALRGGVSVVALAGAGATTIPTGNPDAEILALEKRAKDIVAQWPDDSPDEQADRLGNLETACYDRMAELPAHTTEGMKAKVRLIVGDPPFAEVDCRWQRRAVDTLLADLERLGKGGAA